jgi:S-adenosylmethionine:tRNA ribosyltransferase-isomerase
MKLDQLRYSLPKELIAQEPAELRDHSRLMVINRVDETIEDKHFYDLPSLLTPNEVLVFNQTKVFPARLQAKKATGGNIEILLLERTNSAENEWFALRRGKISFGQTLAFGDIDAKVTQVKENVIKLLFSCRENELFSYMKTHGQTPLPPYIKSTNTEEKIRKDYQTIYAKTAGSVAAPTAGLHFTKELISKLKDKNIQIEYVTLHVGLGTFLPIKENDLTKHKMHSEHYSIDLSTIKRLNLAKSQGKKIISVGTTTTRVLESISSNKGLLSQNKLHGETSIFIYPPYKFKFIDGLITNFHLPGSTLLALVSALVSFPNTNTKFSDFKSSLMGKAYQKAIEEKYRFFSFGDGSLII